MEFLGENLISYAKVIDFLKKNKKGKNFFNTLRTRHKLIHKPIIKPPVSFTIEGIGKIRRGRSVFYLNGIIPFLTEIIRLHDKEHLTFRQIEDRMRENKLQLDALRRFELLDDKRLKPVEFVGLFEIAKIKLKDYMKWPDESEDIKYLNHISSERRNLGEKFYELTKELRDAAKKGIQTVDKEAERESIGERLDFYHQIMDGVIKQLNTLHKKKKIKITAADLMEADKLINKSLDKGSSVA
jgi:hypothetical protein